MQETYNLGGQRAKSAQLQHDWLRVKSLI